MLWPLALFLLAQCGSSQTPVVLRPCEYDATGLVAPLQRYSYNAALSTLELQDGSGRCLTLSPCAGANGDLAVLAPCSPTGACQAWAATGPSASPPSAFTSPSGRCLEVNGAHNANILDVYDCAVTQWRNQEWAHNATSGAVTSLDTDAACCQGKCLTPGAPAPQPPPNLKIGAYDYFVDESSPVMYHGQLLMFESIVFNSPQWAGHWLPAFAACKSYFRVRDMRTLAVVVNITSSCDHAFGAAVVYVDPASGAETLLVSGTPWTRTGVQGGREVAWTGPCQDKNNCTGEEKPSGKWHALFPLPALTHAPRHTHTLTARPRSPAAVDLFYSSDPALSDASWSAAVPGIAVPGIGVYNNDIMAVPASAGLPYKWVMALEVTGGSGPPRFAASAAASPTEVSAWALLNASHTVDGGSCPSLRHDGTFFYYLTGGTDIMMLRSRDLRDWTQAKALVLSHAEPGDCVVAPAWFGAPTGYVPTGDAAAHMAACGATGNYGDDSDVDLVEWPQPFGAAAGGPAVLLQYGSGNQATFGFSNLALFNGSMVEFLQSYF